MVIAFLKDFLKNKKRNYVLVSQVINAIIALIAGKLIALFISPLDFGLYNLQWAAYIFFSSLLLSPLLQFIKTSNNTLLPKIGSKHFMYTAIILLFVTIVLLSIFIYSYDDTTDGSIYLIFLLIVPLAFVNSVLGDYFKTKNMLINFSRFSVMTGALGIFFLAVYFGFGLEFFKSQEVLWSMKIIGILGSTLVFFIKYKLFKASIAIAYRTYLKKYIRFAWPLVLLAIWSWVNNYFDRYAIDYFLSTEEVGIYNASYSVGSKFFLLISPIFMVILTPRVYAQTKKEVKKKEIKKFGVFYFLLSIPIIILIYLFRDGIGSILLSKFYKDGFFIIFWIALAYFLLTSTQLIELLFFAEQKTKIILFASILSALINITFNIVLIPKLGILGAALATCFGFIIHLTFVIFNFRKI